MLSHDIMNTIQKSKNLLMFHQTETTNYRNDIAALFGALFENRLFLVRLILAL